MEHEGFDIVSIILYSGKLSRKKLFANFAVLCLSAKLFSHDCLKARSTLGSTSEQSTKSHFSANSRKFSPSNDSHYTVFYYYIIIIIEAYNLLMHRNSLVLMSHVTSPVW